MLEGLGLWLPDVNWSTSYFFVFSPKGGRVRETERVNPGLILPGIRESGRIHCGPAWEEGHDLCLGDPPLSHGPSLGADSSLAASWVAPPAVLLLRATSAWARSWAVVAEPHLLPHSFPMGRGVKRKSQEVRGPHTGNVLVEFHPRLTCWLTLSRCCGSGTPSNRAGPSHPGPVASASSAGCCSTTGSLVSLN